MNRRILARTVAWCAAAVLTASACSTGAASLSGTTAATPTATRPHAPGTTAPFLDGGLDLVVLHREAATAAVAYDVVDTASRRTLFTLPEGAISSDWRTLVATNPDGAATKVLVMGAEGGDLRAEISVPGAWRLPTVSGSGRAAGVSPDGSTAVLEEAASAGAASAAGRTRFAIVPTSGSTRPRIVTLEGAFAYDALSPDGAWLYLIQHVAGADPTHYIVRRLGTGTGVLQGGAIVDKRNASEPMNGYAVTQQPGLAGWVYTVYRGHDGAFVHALDTADGIAFCIDLPSSTGEDATTGAAWGLALDASGSILYAANPALRTVSEIGLADFSVRRTQTLATSPTIELAKFESARPAGGRLAISPDGKTLYVLEANGIRLVRMADLATTGHLGGDTAFRSLAAGSGSTLYAVDDAGRALVMDVAGGGTYPFGQTRYSAIVAVVPIR